MAFAIKVRKLHGQMNLFRITCPACGQTREATYNSQAAIPKLGHCYPCSMKLYRGTDREFIAKRIKKLANGCWEWQGAMNPNGYGGVTRKGHSRLAHRMVWSLLVGSLTPGLVLDHLCKNTRCVNPQHIRETTQRVNVLASDSIAARNLAKTHCKHGHPFTTENTKRCKHGRVCLICRRARDKKRWPSRRAASVARIKAWRQRMRKIKHAYT